MIPGGRMYGFCIGNGYTREKIAKNLCENSSKNIEFELNGSFHGALELGNIANDVKRYYKSDGDNRFSQTMIFDRF